MSSAVSYEQDFLENLYVEKKYKEVVEALCAKEKLNDNLKKKLGYAYYHSHQFEKAFEVFDGLKLGYQKGQCQLMLGNLEQAYDIFDKATPTSAVLWGRCLVELVQMKLSKPPSFLQIRNFFESDLNMFIECGKTDYAENLIRWNELLSDLNSETYKFIGKVLLFNGYYKLAKDYLTRSKDILPGDPESYYYLAHFYSKFEENEIAIKLLKQAIEINPEYAPAKGMLERLESINK